MIEIDASMGEGGGQIVRTALSLSMITGRAVTLTKIRAERRNPGLMRRHLTAIEAAVTVCSGTVTGNTLGSQNLTFEPGAIEPSTWRFAVGAGQSAVALLLMLLPALMAAKGPCGLVLKGGTHSPSSPPFEFIEKTLAPLLRRMGVRLDLKLDRYGFNPAGGGRFAVTVELDPDGLQPLQLPTRGAIVSKRATALLAHLDTHIGQRELDTVAEHMTWDPSELHITSLDNTIGPGNAVLIEIETEHLTEVFSGIGERGVRAEQIASDASEAARDWLAAEVPASRHTAENLIIPIAMAGAGALCTVAINRHTQATIDLTQQFMDVEIAVANIRGQWHIEI